MSIAWANDALASPQDVIGYGAKSGARAGTGTASAEGYEAVYKNPALLTLTDNPEVNVGLVGIAFSLSGGEKIGTVASDGIAAGILGGTLPVPLPDELDGRVAIGFAFFTPFDLVVRSRILYPETPQFTLSDRVAVIAAQAGLGVDIGYGVRLGIGFEALAALTGNVLAAVDASGRIGAVVQDTLVASYAPVVGVSVDIGDDYRAGLSFRGPLEGKFDVKIEVKDVGTITVPPLFVSGVAQYDPLQLEAEFARVSGAVKGALAVAWKHWSAYPGLAEATVRCPFDPPSGEVLPCAALVPVDPDYSDTVVARASVEITLVPRDGLEMDLRAGYAIEPTPAPEQTGESNVFEEPRSIFAIGYGLDLGEPIVEGFSVDVFAQLHLLHGRTHEKDPSVSPQNLGTPSAETSGYLLAAGTTMGVAF